MSELGQMDVPEEIIEAIQASLPDGQVVRHIGLFFVAQIGFSGNPVLSHETFVAVTDDLVAFRSMRWDKELTAQQVQEKQALESEQTDIQTSQTKVPKFAKGLRIGGVLGKKSEQEKKRFSDSQILEILTKKYGSLYKWLPEIISSSDMLLKDFIIKKYAEIKPSQSLVVAFEKRAHQKNHVGYFEYTVDGSTETLYSFFDDIRKIYDHIRNAKLGNLPLPNSATRITKCLNCGSTELTARGAQLVCDFCQSKY